MEDAFDFRQLSGSDSNPSIILPMLEEITTIFACLKAVESNTSAAVIQCNIKWSTRLVFLVLILLYAVGMIGFSIPS